MLEDRLLCCNLGLNLLSEEHKYVFACIRVRCGRVVPGEVPFRLKRRVKRLSSCRCTTGSAGPLRTHGRDGTSPVVAGPPQDDFCSICSFCKQCLFEKYQRGIRVLAPWALTAGLTLSVGIMRCCSARHPGGFLQGLVLGGGELAALVAPVACAPPARDLVQELWAAAPPHLWTVSSAA